MKSSPAHRISLASLLCVILISLLLGQANGQDYIYSIGAPRFTTALPVESGFFNVPNGNLHLEIPLGSWTQRGTIGNFSASIVYDSRIWLSGLGPDGLQWYAANVPNSQGGWRLITSADAGTSGQNSTTTTCNDSQGHPFGVYVTYNPFTWTDPSGIAHTFPITTQHSFATGCGSDSPNGSADATDGSGLHMLVSNFTNVTIYGPDGRQLSPTVRDTNGNSFSRNANGDVLDTLLRAPVTTIQNCNGNSNQTCYDVLNSRGLTSRYTVTYTTVLASTSFNKSGVPERTGYPITVIDTIGLPDTSSYHFLYDSHAELASIQLPTSATVNYG